MNVEIKVLELTDDYIRLVVKGEDHTLLNLLTHYLLEDEEVLLAKYHIPHPLTGEPELVVRTNGKSPVQAIKEANERIIKATEELISQI